LGFAKAMVPAGIFAKVTVLHVCIHLHHASGVATARGPGVKRIRCE
jgi:hypothetical protein